MSLIMAYNSHQKPSLPWVPQMTFFFFFFFFILQDHNHGGKLELGLNPFSNPVQSNANASLEPYTPHEMILDTMFLCDMASQNERKLHLLPVA